MIDIKELQIGNKVKYKDSIVEIAATHLTSNVGILGAFQSMIVSVKCEEIEPIEVTYDLLKKVGFKSTPAKDIFGNNAYQNNNISNLNIIVCKNLDNSKFDCAFYDNSYRCESSFSFKYLHELQNGIRLITKKDLDTLEVML